MEWDAGNSTKSQTKHGFRTADVESILDAAVVFAGRIVEPVHDEARDAEDGEGGLRCSDVIRAPVEGP
jgi:hypothetical protein